MLHGFNKKGKKSFGMNSTQFNSLCARQRNMQPSPLQRATQHTTDAIATCNATCNRRHCNLQHLVSRQFAAARVCAGLDCKVSASAQQRIGSIFKIANLEERNVWGELRKARSRQRATRE